MWLCDVLLWLLCWLWLLLFWLFHTVDILTSQHVILLLITLYIYSKLSFRLKRLPNLFHQTIIHIHPLKLLRLVLTIHPPIPHNGIRRYKSQIPPTITFHSLFIQLPRIPQHSLDNLIKLIQAFHIDTHELDIQLCNLPTTIITISSPSQYYWIIKNSIHCSTECEIS